ncbi:hypothetical protein, partial [Pseudomonas carnis]
PYVPRVRPPAGVSNRGWMQLQESSVLAWQEYRELRWADDLILAPARPIMTIEGLIDSLNHR